MTSYKLYLKIIIFCFILKLVSSKNISHRLLKRFNDVKSKCYDSHHHKKPAFQCSGLMIRGVSGVGSAERKHAWDKQQKNRDKNAFSMAYLRKDQIFHGFPFGHDSGFIIYPHLKTPKGKNKYDVLCAFPLDAYTDSRNGKHGCGPSRDDPSGKSGHCDKQGITTLKKWIVQYEQITNSNSFLPTKQCGFDTTTKHGARNFAVSLEANKYLREHSTKWKGANNELRLRGWNQNNPKKLPLEAFFYLLGTAGEQKARQYQQDYFALTGRKVPVVGIRLPQGNDHNLIVKG